MPVLALLGIPNLDDLRELLRRIQEMLALGGVALALAISSLFVLAWVLSHLRRPAPRPNTAQSTSSVLAIAALWLSYVPIALTAAAAVASFVPPLASFVLKSFALAVVTAAVAWCVATGAVLAGGTRQSLRNARRALLQAGTPWYCLTVYLSTFL